MTGKEPEEWLHTCDVRFWVRRTGDWSEDLEIDFTACALPRPKRSEDRASLACKARDFGVWDDALHLEFNHPLASCRRGRVLCAGLVLRAQDDEWDDERRSVRWPLPDADKLRNCEAVVEGFFEGHWVALPRFMLTAND